MASFVHVPPSRTKQSFANGEIDLEVENSKQPSRMIICSSMVFGVTLKKSILGTGGMEKNQATSKNANQKNTINCFNPVVSAVAFVYPAFHGRCRPGHSVVRAAGAKRSTDHGDQTCYRPCSVAGLACSDSVIVHHNHGKNLLPITQARRQAGRLLCQLPLKRRS